jgi:hypothetical protein
VDDLFFFPEVRSGDDAPGFTNPAILTLFGLVAARFKIRGQANPLRK